MFYIKLDSLIHSQHISKIAPPLRGTTSTNEEKQNSFQMLLKGVYKVPGNTNTQIRRKVTILCSRRIDQPFAKDCRDYDQSSAT